MIGRRFESFWTHSNIWFSWLRTVSLGALQPQCSSVVISSRSKSMCTLKVFPISEKWRGVLRSNILDQETYWTASIRTPWWRWCRQEQQKLPLWIWHKKPCLIYFWRVTNIPPCEISDNSRTVHSYNDHTEERRPKPNPESHREIINTCSRGWNYIWVLPTYQSCDRIQQGSSQRWAPAKTFKYKQSTGGNDKTAAKLL